MAALNFPNNPNTNDRFPEPPVSGIPTWIWDGQKWRIVSGNDSTRIYVAPTTPVGAPENSLWYDTVNEHLHLLIAGVWVDLIGGQIASSGGGLVNIRVFSTPGAGTYVKSGDTRAILVVCTGAGGSAGCSQGGSPWNNASGGDAGGTAIAFADISNVPSVNYWVGNGGATNHVASTDGASGETSQFGSYATATGGGGGATWGVSPMGNRPGIGTVGVFKLRGCPGQSPTGAGVAGGGGASFWGGAGGADLGPGPTAGIMGGGGGTFVAPGGPGRPGMRGGDGIIVVFELYGVHGF